MNPPILDVVILVHDQAGWADLAVRAVEHHTKNPHRIIVVDNASVEQKTKDLFKEVEARGHTVIHLAENRSFSNGYNAGINAGTSKFICILNSDAIVCDGWDGAMLQDASEKSVGLVGAAQAEPLLALQAEPPFLVFTCIVMRRDIWNTVGPLDEENFTGFSSEDVDYSLRVKKAGYRLKISKAQVMHAVSRTIAAKHVGAEAQMKNNEKYNQVLFDKWGKDFVLANTKLQKQGLVVTYHAEEWARVDFWKHMMGLRRSDGVGFSYLQVCRAPIHMARTIAADYALDNGFDWLVQIDDDATFPSDVLRRLLSHQKDVVCALAYQRKPPHLACVFEIGEDGLMGRPMENIEHTGLRRVDCSGFHCSIIHTSVFKRLREGTKDADGKVLVPGTRQYYGSFSDKVGEDFNISLAMKRIGIQMYCDTELISGHIGSAIVVDENYKKAFQAGRMP